MHSLHNTPGETGDSCRRPAAAELVLAHILEEMSADRLRPGMRVNAAKIQQALDLSATPVREALSLLAGQGVVDLLPDRGAVMRLIETDEVRHLWEVLTPIAIVGLSAAAVAVNDGAEPKTLIAAFAEIEASPRSIPPIAFLDRLNEYHFVANLLGGNAVVTRALKLLGLAYWNRFIVQLIDVRANLDGYLRTYARLHDAVMAGDARSVVAIMHYHKQWSLQLIEAGETAPKAKRRRPQKGRHSGG